MWRICVGFPKYFSLISISVALVTIVEIKMMDQGDEKAEIRAGGARQD